MGFKLNEIQQHKSAVNLEGFGGDKREQTAEIVIPRRAVGGAANDIGFKLQEDGTYEAIISEYDQGNGQARRSKHWNQRGYSSTWLGKLNQRYAYHNLKEELSAGGFFIESECEEDGEILMEVSSTFGE